MVHARRPLLTGIALVLGALWTSGCHDRSSSPESWTVTQLHGPVGLGGGHQQLACSDCHEETAQLLRQTPCEGCHLELFDTVIEPDHRAGGYTTVCADCHDSHAWRPSFFDHEALGFALEGAHARVVCTGCHPTGAAFGSLPTDCWSCHEAAYVDARPDHGALGFGRQCQECHTSADWRSDAFDHDGTRFALRGAHRQVPCVACHAGGYTETPPDCAACHADTAPRDHFGPDCAACHTDVAWEPSTFDHEPSFPLQRGDHRRYRNDCAACHLEPADYGTFTCTDCHDGEHDRRDTDREHDEVGDYRYDSAACYDCHPRGTENDGEDGDDD